MENELLKPSIGIQRQLSGYQSDELTVASRPIDDIQSFEINGSSKTVSCLSMQN